MQTALVLAIATGAALLPSSASAGEADLNLGLQATTTDWPADHGGGGHLDLGYWFASVGDTHFGAKYVGKEHYATVDERLMTYLSINAAVRQDFGDLRLVGTLGAVHQHEETREQLMEAPFSSALGIGDGIRHRAGARAGISVLMPVVKHRRGQFYIALDLDATAFSEDTRGPRWMSSGGLSFGATFDFFAKPAGPQ